MSCEGCQADLFPATQLSRDRLLAKTNLRGCDVRSYRGWSTCHTQVKAKPSNATQHTCVCLPRSARIWAGPQQVSSLFHLQEGGSCHTPDCQARRISERQVLTPSGMP